MLVYDLAIINLIPEMYAEKDPNYQYCDDWGDYKNMGIAVIAVIDSVDLSAYFFSEERLDPIVFSNLKSLDIFSDLSHEYLKDFPAFVGDYRGANFIGFNNYQFDEVIYANFRINFHGDYDLLKLIRLAAFGSDAPRRQPVGHTYSLAAIAAANGYKKIGNHATTSKLWQDGDRGAVVDYCFNNCYVTDKILNLAILGDLIDPNTGQKLKIDFHLQDDYFQ